VQKLKRSKLLQQLKDSKLREIHFIFGFTAATPRPMFDAQLMRTRDSTSTSELGNESLIICVRNKNATLVM